MASLARLQRGFLQKARSIVSNRVRSTVATKCETPVQDLSACKPEKQWISYGFEYESEIGDRLALHCTMFASVTLCLVVGGYVFMYAPDYALRDWAQREAYLEIKRREEANLPLIDKELINPKKIRLPSEEEIGNMEIII
ncbi:NADH dehydrogenase [ubiquinone] 1 beta subcomplex subunit 11, mitochondrial [Agrilus planipennis]|uniref:NADH dehydrogenase [ubiquinone] 1 beta subcomplex subunit 11, mitochondrial n=1 Tax=Agrilus planipennis TaxID=224129 RepID=A0A1W4WQC4_AGRPL|nr:NADH dehydrogenase [ubiquinone] 1 beta subcomplex subunit 11, mitochondrial [Agrilus planipennis]